MSGRRDICVQGDRVTDDPWERFITEGEGLVHISELAERRVSDPGEVVRVADAPPMRIVSVDTERRRPSLSGRLAAAP